MLSKRLGLWGRDKLVAASPRAYVLEASRLMLEHGATAVVVVEGDLLIGILTVHDVVLRVVAAGRDPGTVCIEDVMTREPVTVGPDATLGHALTLMRVNGFGHLPIVEAGRPVGLVLARSALDPELEDFVSEERRRQAFD